MFTRLIALVFIMGMALSTQASSPAPVMYSSVQTEKIVPNISAVMRTTFWLITKDTTKPDKSAYSGCGGTAIGLHVFVTATHCMAKAGDKKNVVSINLNAVQVLDRVDDGQDNTMIKLDADFREWATISKRKPTWGDEVFIFGNPGTLVNIYRHGDVVGFASPGYTLVELNTGHGDSGSGIFNNYGEVIGVVSEVAVRDLIDAKTTAFHPMAFTPEQFKRMGVGN